MCCACQSLVVMSRTVITTLRAMKVRKWVRPCANPDVDMRCMNAMQSRLEPSIVPDTFRDVSGLHELVCKPIEADRIA